MTGAIDKRLLALGLLCLLLAQGLAQWAWHERPRPVVGSEIDEAAAAELGELVVQLDAGEFAGTLLLGGLRGLVADLLWMRALQAQEDGRFYESVAVFQLISEVQPRYPQVWEHLAQVMAFDIAHSAGGEQERWSWYLAGVEALADGTRRNLRRHRLWRKLSWFFFHKGGDFLPQSLAQDWSAMVNPLLVPLDEAIAPVAVARVAAVDADGLQLTPMVGSFQAGQRFALRGEGRRAGELVIVDASAGQARWQAKQPDAAPPPVGAEVSEVLSAYSLAARLYGATWHLAAAELRPDISQVKRLQAMAHERESNRLSNVGAHRQALAEALVALRVWQEERDWRLSQAGDSGGFRLADTSYRRNAGRLRRRAAWLARRLAVEHTDGDALSQAIEADDLDRAEQLLAEQAFRPHMPASAGVVWYDRFLAE